MTLISGICFICTWLFLGALLWVWDEIYEPMECPYCGADWMDVGVFGGIHQRWIDGVYVEKDNIGICLKCDKTWRP